MTNRELLHATMEGQNGDALLHMELGFNVPYKRWYRQGMPTDVQNTDWTYLSKERNLYDYFNVSGFLFQKKYTNFAYPAYEEKILSDDGMRKTYINSMGNTLVEISGGGRDDEGSKIGSPPHEIAFAITCMDDYLENRHRYVQEIEKRIDRDWITQNSKEYNSQNDFIVTYWAHGPFAYLREILGTENAMIMPYEDPDLIEMMLDDHLKTSMAVAEPYIKACKPDWAFIWEDCCGSTGPFMSPDIFDSLFANWYRQWKDFTRSMGVRWTVLDTDGNPSALVKRWYENGIDCMHPWEVNGIDMLKFAEEYPQYKMMGGIYKHMFEPNSLSQVGKFKSTNVHECIDCELARIFQVMKNRGGYIPALDHWAYWAVDFEDYKYYSEKLLDYGKANQVTRNFI